MLLSDQWNHLLANLSDDLTLSQSMEHPSLRKGVKLVRVANFVLRDREHARALHFKSRRIWLGIQIPGSPKRKLLDTTHEALKAWKDILTGTPFLYDMLPPPYFPVLASADACATQHEAGLGGLLRINGQVVAWFAFQISFQEAQTHFPWLSDSMQKHINVWELLGQYCLAYCLDKFLHGRNHAVAAIFACDNRFTTCRFLFNISLAFGMMMLML